LDRFSITVRHGYRRWLRKAADELSLDVSKLARLAIEDYIKVHMHRLSDELRTEFDQLKRGHGIGRYGDLL
jgi:hypothetical protein